MWRVLAAGLIGLVPSVAAACPQCAGNSGGGPAFGITLAAMILLPFPIVGTVYFFMKKSEEASANETE